MASPTTTGPIASPIEPVPASGPRLQRRETSATQPTDSASAGRSAQDADGVWSEHDRLSQTLYWTVHASCLLAFVTGVRPLDIALCLGLYWLRMFAITGGYHRYFAHRSYRTSRTFQFALAFIGCSSIQKGPLWWAAGHRRHHQYSDQPGDMHSPREGFWYAHQGWIFDTKWGETELQRIADFSRYPELVWLNRWHVVPPTLLGLACFALGGLGGFVWGFCISTTMLWHATYSINSLAHRYGSQRYDNGDDSRNNPWLALLTLGEGWHNNHHRYMGAARNGFFWWEIDITYYVLLGLEKLGVVWSLRLPPAEVLEVER
jgi:stearoyl-CoA desaturase (delta-9 desaturase)